MEDSKSKEVMNPFSPLFSVQRIDLDKKQEGMLINGDCLQMLGFIHDETVDMLLTDPPYSSGAMYATGRKQTTSAKYLDNAYGGVDLPDFVGDNRDLRSWTRYMAWVLQSYYPKMRQGGIVAVFCDWRQLPSLTDALQMAGYIWRGIVPWDKKNSRPHANMYRNQCEYVVWGTKGALRKDVSIYGPGIVTGAMPLKGRIHQTQKPVEILEQLMQLLPPNSVVVDPFMGSGSTAIAAKKQGHRFYGAEIEWSYFEQAEKRIEEFRDKEEE